MMAARGFTLIEVVVALLLLSLTALALVETLVAAQRAQQIAGQWMRATVLAEEAVERGRGARLAGGDTVLGFRRRWTVTASGADLDRIDVVVEWDRPRPQQHTLSVLVSR